MSSFQSIVIPALLAFSIYALATFVVLPLWRRHRARYAQYLPVQNLDLDLDHFSSSTLSSARTRIKEALLAFLLPFRHDVRPFMRGGSSSGSDLHNAGPVDDFDTNDEVLDDEFLQGENLTQLGQILAARREAHEARRAEVERRQRVDSSDRRLSRDLEQGFLDGSDDSDDSDGDGHDDHAGRAEVEGRGLRAQQERWRAG